MTRHIWGILSDFHTAMALAESGSITRLDDLGTYITHYSRPGQFGPSELESVMQNHIVFFVMCNHKFSSWARINVFFFFSFSSLFSRFHVQTWERGLIHLEGS